MATKEQQQELAEIVARGRQALKDAVAFADEHGLAFRWDESYGSAQQEYVGKGFVNPDYANPSEDDWVPSGYDETGARERGGWVSSSDHC